MRGRDLIFEEREEGITEESCELGLQLCMGGMHS